MSSLSVPPEPPSGALLESEGPPWIENPVGRARHRVGSLFSVFGTTVLALAAVLELTRNQPNAAAIALVGAFALPAFILFIAPRLIGDPTSYSLSSVGLGVEFSYVGWKERTILPWTSFRWTMSNERLGSATLQVSRAPIHPGWFVVRIDSTMVPTVRGFLLPDHGTQGGMGFRDAPG
jgi:hypothetical protein